MSLDEAGVADIATCFLAAAILLSHAICMLAFGHPLKRHRARSTSPPATSAIVGDIGSTLAADVDPDSEVSLARTTAAL